ncbi:MAG TPA: hypothetical protein VI636_02285 [Candidatus Angelobacter sp.]
MLNQIPNNLLRIPSQNGAPVNEYRIHQGQIEFRSLGPQNKSISPQTEGWRSLDASDIQLHFALKTIVAQWLMDRLGSLREGG